MNTPAHLIFGVAAFGRPGQPKVTASAVLGALAPDLSLYLMVGVSIYVLGIEPRVVFRELYYSDPWQAVFAIDNSFVLWGAAFAVGLWLRNAILMAFAGAALLHLAFDFPLHGHDARMHFWPLSHWVFESPVSYWDRNSHGDLMRQLELAVSLLLCVLLMLRYRLWWKRGLIALLAVAETLASGIWRFVF